MVQHQLKVADVMMKDPNMSSAGVNVGQMGNNATGGGNTGRMFVELKPRSSARCRWTSHRRAPEAERDWHALVPAEPAADQSGTGGQNRALYQFTMQDADTDELYKWPVLEQQIRQMPGFEDVSSDLQLNNPQVTVEMDRDKLSSLGLTATQVENALYNAATGRSRRSTRPTISTRSFCAWRRFQNDPAAMSLLYVGRCGRLIPLESVARLKTAVGPLQVNHFGQLPSVMISFNLARASRSAMPSRRSKPCGIDASGRSRCSSRARRRRFRTRCAGWAWCC